MFQASPIFAPRSRRGSVQLPPPRTVSGALAASSAWRSAKLTALSPLLVRADSPPQQQHADTSPQPSAPRTAAVVPPPPPRVGGASSP
eukprot:5724857-Prymnesium_polylepis.1